MIAEHLDGIFDDLLRFQHPDYPCYVNGYYWQYHQCFGMMDVLADQIELRDLRLGHYIDEILLQLDIITERLEDEGANQEVIKMAKDQIIRFKAISKRDSQPKVPSAVHGQ